MPPPTYVPNRSTATARLGWETKSSERLGWYALTALASDNASADTRPGAGVWVVAPIPVPTPERSIARSLGRGVLDGRPDPRADARAIERRQHRRRLGQRSDGTALERVDVVDRLDGVPAARIDAEHGARCLLRDAQGRAERRDAADAGKHVRDLRDRSIGQRQPEDVRQAAGIAHEVDLAAVAAPLRIDVLRTLEVRQARDLRAAARLRERHLVWAVRERIERRREPIGHERDLLAGGRPRGFEIG